MKKIIGILVITMLSSLNANAEILSVGVNGNAGMLDATGTHYTDPGFEIGKQSRSEELAMAYASGFAELHVPDILPLIGNLRVGLSYVPYALESETTTSKRVANVNDTTKSDATQKVQVDIENLTQYYLSYHMDLFAGSLFIKGGWMEADLKTNEKLETGSKYADAILEGQFLGLGYDKNLNDGLFVRAEVAKTQFDSISVKSTDSLNVNKVTLDGIDGVNATIAIGKTF